MIDKNDIATLCRMSGPDRQQLLAGKSNYVIGPLLKSGLWERTEGYGGVPTAKGQALAEDLRQLVAGVPYNTPRHAVRFYKDDPHQWQPYTLRGHDCITDKCVMLHGTMDNLPRGATPRVVYMPDTHPDAEKIVPREKTFDTIVPVTFSLTLHGLNTVTFDNGIRADVRYVDLILSRFPGAVLQCGTHDRFAIVASTDGEFTGAGMVALVGLPGPGYVTG